MNTEKRQNPISISNCTLAATVVFDNVLAYTKKVDPLLISRWYLGRACYIVGGQCYTM